MTVELANSSLISFCTVASVLMSMLAVASSIITILFFLRMALQMQISCLSPELKFSPLLPIGKFRPELSPQANASRPAARSSLRISPSSFLFSGSRLNLRVPLNSVASCGMIVILVLRSAMPTLLMSTPSILMLPDSFSMILQMASQRVLLPAPVLPTTPTFSPWLILRQISFSTMSVSGRYFMVKWSNSIMPLEMNCSPKALIGRGFLCSASCGISSMLTNLLNETIWTSTVAPFEKKLLIEVWICTKYTIIIAMTVGSEFSLNKTQYVNENKMISCEMSLILTLNQLRMPLLKIIASKFVSCNPKWFFLKWLILSKARIVEAPAIVSPRCVRTGLLVTLSTLAVSLRVLMKVFTRYTR
mmetsp:Transcript_1598/g.1956  ORF Transcript_1598/g.1956 Transcript_1598/m.1956 type:complete len:360 (+) Transcript_1598:152-1231(+)